jgi:hypothetical protein
MRTRLAGTDELVVLGPDDEDNCQPPQRRFTREEVRGAVIRRLAGGDERPRLFNPERLQQPGHIDVAAL